MATKLDSKIVNPLRANPTKWSNTFKQFVTYTNQVKTDLKDTDNVMTLRLRGYGKKGYNFFPAKILVTKFE